MSTHLYKCSSIATAASHVREANLQAKRKLTGIMNFTNPGVVSHNEILEMYKEYIDPEFSWSNFSLEEQAKVPTLSPVCADNHV